MEGGVGLAAFGELSGWGGALVWGLMLFHAFSATWDHALVVEREDNDLH